MTLGKTGASGKSVSPGGKRQSVRRSSVARRDSTGKGVSGKEGHSFGRMATESSKRSGQ